MTAGVMTSRQPSTRASDRSPLVVLLSSACDDMLTGGKAANLSRLQRDGHLVPEGFVLTDAAYQLFVGEADLEPEIEMLCARLDARSPAGIHAAAETIAALIRQAPMPAPVQDAIDRCAALLGSGTLIVRSSAIGEDSSAASFAGQLDSITGVRGAGFLRLAVLDVWASRWSARSLAYQLARRVRLAGMGVIVQRQIDSRIAGVLFTKAPVDDGRMLIEYCEGMGEAVVSGRENPGRIAVDREQLRWRQQAAPDRLTNGARFPSDAAIASLARTALAIERTFGAPQDIEWSLDEEDRIWIVQARPLTAAARAAERADAVHWSNANVNENFPAPISPLLYSIAAPGYYHYFRNLGRAFGISRRRLAAMERPLREIIGVQAGRMYYNLTSIHGVLRSAPFGELLTGSFNQFVGAGTTGAPAAAGRFSAGRTLARQTIEASVIVCKTAWQYAFLTRRVARFERTVDEFARRTRADALRRRRIGDLLDDLRAFVEIRNHRWIGASLADAAAMVSYGLLQRLLARTLPAEEQHALQNNLLKALPGLVSSQPAIELWNLSRLVRTDERLRVLFQKASGEILETIEADSRFAPFRGELRRYLDDWGFRCSGELMLTVPSFREQPARVIDLVKTYAAMDGESPAEILVRQQQLRLDETARVARTLRARRLVGGVPLLHAGLAVTPILRATQTSILLRERARLKQALLYVRLRHVALAIGARLAAAGTLERDDDVFLLTVDEVLALGGGTAMFPFHVRELIALRRQAHAAFATMAPPDAMTLDRGTYWVSDRGQTPGGSPAEGSPPASPADATAGPELRGTSACGGSVTARAAVLADVTDADRLTPGDVLVTKQTDPGWGPLFPLVSGLVIERGGMLSHGAIIAREFGLPSVVGVPDATARIPHGSRIHVDGDRGVVRIVGGSHDA